MSDDDLQHLEEALAYDDTVVGLDPHETDRAPTPQVFVEVDMSAPTSDVHRVVGKAERLRQAREEVFCEFYGLEIRRV